MVVAIVAVGVVVFIVVVVVVVAMAVAVVAAAVAITAVSTGRKPARSWARRLVGVAFALFNLAKVFFAVMSFFALGKASRFQMAWCFPRVASLRKFA